MARPLRIELAGAWYHVTARGTERSRIVVDDRDRHRWQTFVAEVVEMFHLVVRAAVGGVGPGGQPGGLRWGERGDQTL